MSIYEYNRELHMQVIPDELAVLIRGVKDEQILTRWTELALKTTSVEEFEEMIKL